MSGTHHLHFILQKEIVLCERMWRKGKGRKGDRSQAVEHALEAVRSYKEALHG